VRTMLSSRTLLQVAVASVLLGGCDHSAVRRGADTRIEVPAVTSDELFEIGLAQARQGDLLRAEQYIVAAGNRGYDEPTVAYWLVRVCVAAGRYHSALDHAARYLRDDPSNWRLRLIVASIHEALGEFDRARLELQHIVSARPDSPLPHYRLAMIYARQASEMQRAAAHFEAYLALDPEGQHAAEVEMLLAHARRPPHRAGGESPSVLLGETEVLP